MAINSHITDEQACLHGIRALEWILQAAQGDVVKIMIEEGVVETCSELLKLQQIELIRYVCGCLSKLAKFSSIFGILDFHDLASLLYVILIEFTLSLNIFFLLTIFCLFPSAPFSLIRFNPLYMSS